MNSEQQQQQQKQQQHRSALEFGTEAELRTALQNRQEDWKVCRDDQDVEKELNRLMALLSCSALDTKREDRLDRLVEDVRRTFHAASAKVSLVDLGRQWFKSSSPYDETRCETSRLDAFCAHTIHADSLLVVPDALQDEQFAKNPSVNQGLLRFYAGAPLITSDGQKIGSLCITDTQPRPQGLSEQEKVWLQYRAKQVVQMLLEFRDERQKRRRRRSLQDDTTPHASAATDTDVSASSGSECENGGGHTGPTFPSLNSSSRCSADTKRLRATQCAMDNDESSTTIIPSPMKMHQQPILPSPNTGNVDPDVYLVQLVEALWPGVHLKITPAMKLTTYFPTITEEQMSRYNNDIISMARSNDVDKLREYYSTHGRDALDCFNRFGEGLLNLACRRGFTGMAEFLLSPEIDLPVRIRDDYGRTPLHDSCWNPEPQLDICRWILQRDPSLFLVADKRGFTPFQYARKSDWQIWRQFLFDNRQYLQALTHPDITSRFA